MNSKVKNLLVVLAIVVLISVGLFTIDHSEVLGWAGPGLDPKTSFSIYDFAKEKIVVNVNGMFFGELPEDGELVFADVYELRFRFEEKDLLPPILQIVFVWPSVCELK
jgi:hypothetical protein